MKKQVDEYIENPFRHPGIPSLGIEYTYTCDAESRLRMVKNFNIDQLKAVLALTDIQKQVRLAAERRLRKLERGNG